MKNSISVDIQVYYRRDNMPHVLTFFKQDALTGIMDNIYYLYHWLLITVHKNDIHTFFFKQNSISRLAGQWSIYNWLFSSPFPSCPHSFVISSHSVHGLTLPCLRETHITGPFLEKSLGLACGLSGRSTLVILGSVHGLRITAHGSRCVVYISL